MEDGLVLESVQVEASGGGKVQVCEPIRLTRTSLLTRRCRTRPVNWSTLYPEYVVGKMMSKRVEIVAVGDKSDDFLIAMAARLPSTLMTSQCPFFCRDVMRAKLTLETIVFNSRRKFVEATQSRIAALRYENATDVPIPNAVTYGNIAAVLASGLKEIPDFFSSYQLKKVFLCFPTNKQVKQMSRYGFRISDAYANVVQPGGLLYTICENEDATEYLHEQLNSDPAHPIWEPVPEEEWRADECVAVMGETWQNLSPTPHIAVWKRTQLYF